MNRNQQIWLGELIRCWEALAPADDNTRKTLAGLIGLEWQPPVDQRGTEATPAPEPELPPPVEPSAAPPPQPVTQLPEEPPPNPQASELPRVAIEEEAQLQAAEWDAVEVLNPPQPHNRQYNNQLPPLFRPLWSRTIVTTLASRRLPIGFVDAERLVSTMAAARPVERIPRQPRWTTMKGVQLLLDKTPGMAPFMSDQAALAALFDDCVGGEALERLHFFDSPLRGVVIGGKKAAYRPPQPGVPVVAVTDLGLGAPESHFNRAAPGEWLSLVQLLAARDSTLTILLPWPAAAADPGLQRCTAIVEWDRSTSATLVRRLLERICG